MERAALPLNRWPSSHVALSVRSCNFVALDPKGLLAEVQKGAIVLPPEWCPTADSPEVFLVWWRREYPPPARDWNCCCPVRP